MLRVPDITVVYLYLLYTLFSHLISICNSFFRHFIPVSAPLHHFRNFDNISPSYPLLTNFKHISTPLNNFSNWHHVCMCGLYLFTNLGICWIWQIWVILRYILLLNTPIKTHCLSIYIIIFDILVYLFNNKPTNQTPPLTHSPVHSFTHYSLIDTLTHSMALSPESRCNKTI